MESRLSGLAKFNGNYPSRLQSGELTETEVMQQLKRLPKTNHCQVAYIFCPSVSREQGKLVSSQLKATPSTRLFSDTFEIASLGLVCRNLTQTFNGLFQDLLVIKIKDIKELLASTSTIVIFSNDAQEVEKVCAKIKELFAPKPACFFIVANHGDMELELNADIIAQISIQTLTTASDSFIFWKEVRNSIGDLVDLAPAKQATQKCCALM